VQQSLRERPYDPNLGLWMGQQPNHKAVNKHFKLKKFWLLASFQRRLGRNKFPNKGRSHLKDEKNWKLQDVVIRSLNAWMTVL